MPFNVALCMVATKRAFIEEEFTVRFVRTDPLEVAVTGRAVPVDLSVLPGPTLDFGDCTVGHCTTQEIQVRQFVY